MNDVVALIDLYSSRGLDLLTKDRPLASTTFLARYAFIDFALSLHPTNFELLEIEYMIAKKKNDLDFHTTPFNNSKAISCE